MTIAVLFARADSVYKTLPDCDVWDIDRDARRWPGGGPVVARWWPIHLAEHGVACATSQIRVKAKDCWPRGQCARSESLAACLSIRPAHSYGQRPGYLRLVSATNTAVGHCQSCNRGGDTVPKKRRCSTSSAATRWTYQPFPTSWERHRTSFKVVSAPTTDRTSQRPSANTRRQSWPHGLSSWPAAANQVQSP